MSIVHARHSRELCGLPDGVVVNDGVFDIRMDNGKFVGVNLCGSEHKPERILGDKRASYSGHLSEMDGGEVPEHVDEPGCPWESVGGI